MTIENKNKILSTLAVISTFLMVFMPPQIAVPFIRQIAMGVLAFGSLLFQLLLLIIVKDKKKKKQSYILLIASLIVIILMILMYTNILPPSE